jgi:ParB family chromosome partitioning protein
MVLNMGLRDLMQKDSDMMYVDVAEISPGPWQVRTVFRDQSELEASIKKHGILEPVLLKRIESRRYYIVGGERRWRAAKSLEIPKVPARVLNVTDVQALEISMVENVQRNNLSPIEEARGYRKLIDQGKTQEDAAAAVGKSRSHVANILRLLRLPESVQAMVEKGELSASQARTIVGLDECESKAMEIAQAGTTVRELEVARVKPQKNADVQSIAHQIGQIIGMDVGISSRGTGGSIRIVYKNWEEVDKLVDILHSGVEAKR